MFKKHALQVQMVNTKKQNTVNDETAASKLDFDKINTIAKEQTKNIAIAVAGLYAAKKVVDTVSEIAVIAANAKI